MTHRLPSELVVAALERLGLKLIRRPGAPDLRLPSQAAAFLRDHILVRSRRTRLLGALFVDRDVAPIACVIPYVGYLDGVQVEPDRLLAPGIVIRAAGMILFQQRPAARDPVPDVWDVQLTELLRDAGEVVRLRLLDHIVLGQGESWLSLRRYGVVRFHPLGEKVVLPMLARARPRRDRRHTVRPKYLNPERPTQTWAGRGKMARWLREKIEAGAELEEFRVKE